MKLCTFSYSVCPRTAVGNEAGLRTFGYTWDEFTALPSRKSCEEDVREERAELLQNVREFDKTSPAVDYSGVSVRVAVRRGRSKQARSPHRCLYGRAVVHGRAVYWPCRTYGSQSASVPCSYRAM